VEPKLDPPTNVLATDGEDIKWTAASDEISVADSLLKGFTAVAVPVPVPPYPHVPQGTVAQICVVSASQSL
jgi:hypothetical protein